MYRSCVCKASVVGFAMLLVPVPAVVRADAFDGYALAGSFELPQPESVFDCLPDGRIIVLSLNADIYVEHAVGSRRFDLHGTLPDANMPTMRGAAFIRVSPDGTKLAVGNNGGADWHTFEVGIFDFPALTGDWYPIDHYDAAWYDNTHLAVAAGDYPLPSWVTVFDTTSSPANPVNPTVIETIGGASGGITFDASGNLYAGNGWTNDGPSGTGWVKVFYHAVWTPALSGGPALDFEATGTLVVDILSAASLGFDIEGNLHVGGGDALGGIDEQDFVALIRASAVSAAIAGLGPAAPDDPEEVRRFDPDTLHDDDFYIANYNPVTRELYMADLAGTTVYVYMAASIPTVSQWGLVIMSLALLTAGTLAIQRHCNTFGRALAV